MRTAIAAFCVVFILAAPSAPALGAAPNPNRQALLDHTVRFLQESQQESGGFAQAGEPSQVTSAWTALALAAAGINPRNQAQPCGTDAFAYLAEGFRREFGASAAQIATTDLERELLVVNASGTDPHDFAGFDLAGEILARQRPGGSFPFLPGGKGQINATVFAILALSPVDEPAVEPALRRAVEWLVLQQNGDGGWSWLDEGAVSEVDMTGTAIQALNAGGVPSVPAELAAFEAAQQGGLGFLREAQLPDGGFPALPGQRESNVASTAWAVQGIWSAGGDPEAWRTGSGLATEEPLDYMESLQQPDGHIRWSRSADLNGVWMTAYVTPALAGHALPIPEAPFSAASLPPCNPEEGETQTGVIAGGGGKGAPLFSRPKPQSRGRTPGGARIVRNGNLRPRNRSRSRRGAGLRQPTGTGSAEPNAIEAGENSEATAVPAAIGPGEGGGPEGIPPPSAVLRAAARNAPGAGGGREVSGVVVGDLSPARGGEPTFGAPGLRSAAGGGGPGQWVAIGIGGMALLLALCGAQWESRRQEVLP